MELFGGGLWDVPENLDTTGGYCAKAVKRGA